LYLRFFPKKPRAPPPFSVNRRQGSQELKGEKQGRVVMMSGKIVGGSLQIIRQGC